MMRRNATGLWIGCLAVALAVLPAPPAQAQDGAAGDAKTYRVHSLVDLGRSGPPHPRRYGEWDWVILGPLSASEPHGEELSVPDADQLQVARAVGELCAEIAPGIEWDVTKDDCHLVVRGAPEHHKRVETLLDALRTQAGTPFEIDVRYLSVEADPALAPVIERAARGEATADDLQRLAGRDAAKGTRGGRMSIPHGWWSTCRATREMRYMPDFDVEIAQASAVADPLLRPVREGVQASVRPFLLQDGRVLLRVFASAGELEQLRRFRVGSAPGTTEVRRPLSVDFGDLEQADFRGAAVVTEVVLAKGEPAVVVLGQPGRHEVLVFDVREAPASPQASTFTVVPTGALTAADSRWSLGWGEWDDPYRQRLQPVVVDEWQRMKAKSLDNVLESGMRGRAEEGFLYRAEWLHGGALLVRADADGARAVKATVGALEREFLTPARLVVHLVGVDAGVQTTTFISGVDRDAEGDAALGVVGVPLLQSQPVAFMAYRRMDYLADYDVEVAQESRIADPNHDVAYAGVFGNARVDRTRAGYRVRLDLRVQAADPVRVVQSGSPEVGPVQSIPVRTRHARHVIDVAASGRAVLDLGANPFGEGRLLALVTIR